MADAKIDSPDTLPGWHMPWPSFEIDWKKSALVIIDMQNYGCNPDAGVAQMLSLRYPDIASYYVPRLTETAIPNARKLLTAFRRAGRQVMFTRHGPLMPDGRDLIARRRRRDSESVTSTNTPTLWSKGSFEHDIIETLKPEANEMVIDKNTSSAFNSTGIEWMLRNMGIETLVVAGMATDMCVETTSRDAADRGFNVIIAEDASATFFPDHHRAALSGFARVFGQVWASGDVISALQR